MLPVGGVWQLKEGLNAWDTKCNPSVHCGVGEITSIIFSSFDMHITIEFSEICFCIFFNVIRCGFRIFSLKTIQGFKCWVTNKLWDFVINLNNKKVFIFLFWLFGLFFILFLFCCGVFLGGKRGCRTVTGSTAGLGLFAHTLYIFLYYTTLIFIAQIINGYILWIKIFTPR